MKTYNYVFNDDEFEYEPEVNELVDAIKEIILEESGVTGNYQQCQKVLEFIIDDMDMLDKLEEQLYDFLKDSFEAEARIEYDKCCQYDEDIDNWFGTKDDVIGI